MYIQKIIAIVLSINLILLNTLPTWAGGGKEIIRILPRVAESAAATISRNGINSSVLSSVERAALYNVNYPHYQAELLKTVQKGELPELNFALQRAAVKAELSGALDLSVLKETGVATMQDALQAVSLWKNDMAQLAEQIAKQADLFTPNQLLMQDHKAQADTFGHLITEISAVGIFGTAEQDGQAILNTYKAVANTPVAGIVATAAARSLLRLQAYPELAQLAQEADTYARLWEGIGQFAKERNLPLEIAPLEKDPFSLAYAPVLYPYGRLTVNAADPSNKATAWYMDLGLDKLAQQAAKNQNPRKVAPAQVQPPLKAPEQPAKIENTVPLGLTLSLPATPVQIPLAAPAQTKPIPLSVEEKFGGVERFNQVLEDARAFLQSPEFQNRLPENLKDNSTFLQRASLYIASFVIGLEIGTPIMASLGNALGLSLGENILVTVATYLPYSIGAFFTNWLMEKIGRKTTMNIGLALMGGSFLTGATLLGLDGDFAPWFDKLAHYWSILGAITTASLGGVLIHNAAGPIMTDISKNATDLTLQKRGTFVELSRAGGMLSSFAFPFIATSMLTMDWSAPFLMALPFVGAAAIALNSAKIPNSKPLAKAAEVVKTTHGNWMAALKDNKYIRLFKEDKSVAPLLGGLFLMNGVEMAYNSGFLLLLPSLTTDPSSQYLFGLTQFALPFVLGRYMASQFLKWFPKHNLSVATAISAVGGLTAAFVSHDIYPLTAALFTAEMGISTAFTLAFARTAKNTVTQDRITSLIIASAVACAVGPVVFTSIAQTLMDAGLFSVQDATTVALIGLPSLLAMWSTGLFKRVERFVSGNFSKGASSLLKKLWNIMPRRNTSTEE